MDKETLRVSFLSPVRASWFWGMARCVGGGGGNGALEWEAGEIPKAREMELVFGAHQVAEGGLR